MTAQPSDERHLVVGLVRRAVGLKGEVEVEVVSDEPTRFEPGSTVLEARSERWLTVRSVRRNRRATVVGFEDVIDRAGAEALQGAELVVHIAQGRTLGPHEYWDHDLVGCEVVTVDGVAVGTVTDVLHAPANDVLVVGRHLVPLAAGIVVSVDPKKTITIDPIPGLLED